MLGFRESSMHVKRTLVLAVGCGVLAAFFASASTSGRRPIAPPILPKTNAVDATGAERAEEIARLHDRLHPTAVPQQPSRNIFEFRPRPTGPPVAAQSIAAVQAPPSPAPPAPSLKLIGIAEDVGADGPVRSAIITGDSQLFIVKTGEQVTDRYKIVEISSDGVELIDRNDGTTLRLGLN